MSVANRARERSLARPASKQRLRLWLRLLRSSRAIEACLRERLRAKFTITLPQFDVLATLARNAEGMTMTELSRRLMVSNGNVTGIIDRLASEKLVLRQAPASDRRSFIVRLTPRGMSQFSAIAKAHESWIDELLTEIGADEAEKIIERLDGLVRRARNEEARP
ncbi:MAG TPA: MarR family transcriptional regulator [Pseudolabrys sp.]|nr:MarR family transcriptional regulator [Pseudolabrys sp.]